MKAVFVELPAFERHCPDYLGDEAFGRLQDELMNNPLSGAIVDGAGGLRKLRYPDTRRGKGKRGGLRIIYYWWERGRQIWLFTLYDKDEASDLAPKQLRAMKDRLKLELAIRSRQ